MKDPVDIVAALVKHANTPLSTKRVFTGEDEAYMTGVKDGGTLLARLILDELGVPWEKAA